MVKWGPDFSCYCYQRKYFVQQCCGKIILETPTQEFEAIAARFNRAKNDMHSQGDQSRQKATVVAWTRDRKLLKRQKESPLPLLTALWLYVLQGPLGLRKRRRQNLHVWEKGTLLLQGGCVLGSLPSFSIFPCLWKQQAFWKLSNLFLAFPGTCVWALPHPTTFSQASILPLYHHHFGFPCTGLIVLPHQLASTVHVSKRNPRGCFLPSLVNPGEGAAYSPGNCSVCSLPFH